jgi:hypothetical protein
MGWTEAQDCRDDPEWSFNDVEAIILGVSGGHFSFAVSSLYKCNERNPLKKHPFFSSVSFTVETIAKPGAAIDSRDSKNTHVSASDWI